MTIRSDNAVTVCNLQRQGAGTALLLITRAIFSILQELDIRIAVAHIPGKLNTLTDALSRIEVTGDYALRPDLCKQALQMLQIQPTIDLFAHCLNSQLPRFAAIPGPLSQGAVAKDAFSLDWATEVPYVFPPVQLMDRVLQKIQEERVTAVVVAPKWPSRPWWSTLRALFQTAYELSEAEAVLTPGPGMINSQVQLRLPPGIFVIALLRPAPPYRTGNGS
jgi:hypothetical protein